MLKVSCMLTNPLINGATSLSNIGGPTGTRNNINPFHVLRVDRILYRPDGFTNGVEGSKGRGDIVPLKNPGNLISGPLDIQKMDTWDLLFQISFS